MRVLIVTLLLLLATPAHADDPVGVAKYQARDYQGALAAFDAAYANKPTPKLAVWRARTLAALGRLIEADAVYKAIKVDDETLREQVAIEATDVAERIPSIAVRIEGANDVRVTINAKPLANPAAFQQYDPGEYRVVGTHSDGRTVTRAIVLKERDQARVALPFYPPPPDRDDTSTQHVVGWVAVGVGAAAFTAGVIMSVVALTQYNAVDGPMDTCAADQLADADAYNDLRFPAGALTVAGGLTAALGVGLVITGRFE